MNNTLLLLAQMPAEAGINLLEDFSSDQRFALTIVVVSCVTGVVVILGGVIGGVWSTIKQKQIEADIKRDMLDRGMTAEEILKVVEATPQSGSDRWLRSWSCRD